MCIVAGCDNLPEPTSNYCKYHLRQKVKKGMDQRQQIDQDMPDDLKDVERGL
jgi:hypothetical protein